MQGPTFLVRPPLGFLSIDICTDTQGHRGQGSRGQGHREGTKVRGKGTEDMSTRVLRQGHRGQDNRRQGHKVAGAPSKGHQRQGLRSWATGPGKTEHRGTMDRGAEDRGTGSQKAWATTEHPKCVLEAQSQFCSYEIIAMSYICLPVLSFLHPAMATVPCPSHQ